MPRPTELKPSSFAEYIQVVDKLQRQSGRNLWFRGSSSGSYALQPGLYRHKRLKKIEEFSDIEERLIATFRQRSIPYHDKNLSDVWDLLFFMQHYGVPTRLLDWTESPLIGLYFSVMPLPRNTKDARKHSAVWVLDPYLWNQHALRHVSYTGSIISQGASELDGYKPPIFTSANNLPVALYGAHNSPRIVAQRGTFTIFGQVRIPMERLFDSDGFPTNCLTKIVLTSSVKRKMRTSILAYGITESSVFPDLGGLASEIKRNFGF